MKSINTESLAEHAVDLLKRLISVPSYSGKEELTAKIIMNDLEMKGVRFLQKGNNIWTYSKKSDKPKVLLNSHLDTVFPCSDWKYSPFSAKEENGKIYGLGSNDAGGSLVSLLMAYYVCSAMNLPFDLIFAATAEEEITGANGLESILPLLGSLDLAIVGEPTSMQLAIGERGLMVLDVKSEAKSAHVANFEGKHALDIAMEDYVILKNLTFNDEQSKLGKTKITVSQIQAGKQHNVTPHECRMVVDVRTNEIYSNEEILRILKRELRSEVCARSTRLKASFINEKHPVVKLAKTMGISCVISPTISDQSVIPYPSVKIGPGNTSRSHSANEFITVDEIKDGISTYIQILSNLKFS